eukprot:TRINITY_DN5033_c0_g3_i4.p1 TRINITY_DN5033_c0_g3~~TRINITY_DN5033_c0_g3_i4.p1  ORF type:complete len:262 (+),score=40.10 TRINITY_DN5033_c0_g3_i4:554-1339(+)
MKVIFKTKVGTGQKREKKRRSKYDLTGRNFKCRQCNKSYLSYPALYTHSKTKHPAGLSSAKNLRGRPRKVNKTFVVKKHQNFFDFPERQGSTYEPLKVLFKTIVKLEKEIGWGLYTPDEHPLIQSLQNKKETCDNAFINYCIYAAKFTNEVFFEKLCAVILGYRECLNRYGWQKLAEEQYEDVKREDSGSGSPRVSGSVECAIKRKSVGKDYAANNGAEKLPEVANEFVLLFAKEYNLGVPKKRNNRYHHEYVRMDVCEEI